MSDYIYFVFPFMAVMALRNWDARYCGMNSGMRIFFFVLWHEKVGCLNSKLYHMGESVCVMKL